MAVLWTLIEESRHSSLIFMEQPASLAHLCLGPAPHHSLGPAHMVSSPGLHREHAGWRGVLSIPCPFQGAPGRSYLLSPR